MAYANDIRLYVPDELRADDTLTLSADQSHYVNNVMRRAVGTSVLVFNGKEGEWRAEITAASKKSVIVSVQSQAREQMPSPDVWLVFAPLKKDRTDFVIEKATELGVQRILPVITERTQTGRLKEERLRATAIESAEQSHRLDVPTIGALRPLRDVLNQWPSDRTLIHLDENGTGAPLVDVLTSRISSPLAFVIGPEGGFSDSEVKMLGGLPFAISADLGPRILRAETAATTALAIRQGVADAQKRATPQT